MRAAKNSIRFPRSRRRRASKPRDSHDDDLVVFPFPEHVAKFDRLARFGRNLALERARHALLGRVREPIKRRLLWPSFAATKCRPQTNSVSACGACSVSVGAVVQAERRRGWRVRLAVLLWVFVDPLRLRSLRRRPRRRIRYN